MPDVPSPDCTDAMGQASSASSVQTSGAVWWR